MDLSSIYEDLVIVAAVEGCPVDLVSAGECLEDVVVEPLLQGTVLASVLHDFLGDHSSEERGHWGDACTRVEGRITDHLLVKFLLVEALCCLVRLVDALH